MGEIINNNSVLTLRRELREKATKTEKLLWLNLKNRRLGGEKFKRQYSIGRYIIDFYCPKFRLAIEIDGGYHRQSDVMEYDKLRQEIIESYGIKVLRFSNNEVKNQIEAVLKKIKLNFPPSPRPSPPWGRGWPPAAAG